MSGSVTILMIDDREENLLALEAVLSSPDYRLIGLQSGEEALRYILRENTDDLAAILLDVQMPGINGFETARLIKMRDKTKDIPILFLSAYSKSTDHVLKGYHAGSVDYIFKPFHPELLRLKVEAYVRIHKFTQQIRMQGELLQKRALELEEANRKLERMEAFARTVADTSTDAIITFLETGTILSANPASEAIFGYSPAELIGADIGMLLPELNRDGPLNQIAENTAIHKDNRVFPVEFQIGHAVLGELRFFVCSIRDITARKQLERVRLEQFERLEAMVAERTSALLETNRQLRRSQGRFKAMFVSSPCLMSIHRLDDMAILDVNESWLTNTGYDYEEVIGRMDNLLRFDAEAPPQGFQLMREACRNLKTKYVMKTGEIRDGLLSTEIIDLEDEKCVLNVMTDVTEKVTLEKEMARLARLNLIGEMAAGIAHEIRNPMTTIRGFLQMSKKKSGIMSGEYIDIMLEELNRANGIITEYLSLAKNKTTDRQLHNLNAIIETLHPLIQAEATLTGKYVQVVYGKLHPFPLDEKEIRQLILNLAMNGLEAMPVGGVLRIETRREAGDFILKVRDEGCGIKKENIDKLGTPFFTTKDNGTGLGLAVCYSIASRHQARIEVRSCSEGTTFRVCFSAAKPAEPVLKSGDDPSRTETKALPQTEDEAPENSGRKAVQKPGSEAFQQPESKALGSVG